MGNDHQFVRVMGVAAFPFGESGGVGGEDLAGEAGSGAVGADDGFEEGVAGEAIGAVQTGAGDLTNGVQPGEAGSSLLIGDHPAALVMGGRHHRDRFLGDVNSMVLAGGVDVGEPAHDEGRGFVGDVEQDMVGAAAFDLGVDGARDDVAWGQGAEFMMGLHELAAGQCF